MNTDFLTNTQDSKFYTEGELNFFNTKFNVTFQKTKNGVSTVRFESADDFFCTQQVSEEFPCRTMEINGKWFCFLANFTNKSMDSFVVTRMNDGTRTKFYL